MTIHFEVLAPVIATAGAGAARLARAGHEIGLAVVGQFLFFGALLTPLELLVPARPQPYFRRRYLTDLLHFCLNPFLINAGSALLLAGISTGLSLLIAAFAPALGLGFLAKAQAALRAQPYWVQLVEIFFVAEFMQYWVHRLSHEVSWLWRLHAVHHSAEHLDWLVAHRQHPVEAVLLLGVANLPVLLLGFSMEPVYAFVLLQKLYTAFLHANVRVGYGRLGRVLASPQFHHLHHDREPALRPSGSNFASTLPIFDWLFGTYHVPASEFPSRYGIAEPVAQTWLGQLIHPLRRPPSAEAITSPDRR